MTCEDFGFEVIDGCVGARLTPWDRRALGFGTAEITRLEAETVDDALLLLRETETWAQVQGVRYLFGRVPADAGHLRSALSRSGYAMTECSLALSREGFEDLPKVPGRMRLELRPADRNDLPTLQAIARDDFHHGRFLEDPGIDHAAAVRRSINWVADLLDQGLLQTAAYGNQIVGFHAERLSDDGTHARLILTGTAHRYAMLSMPLWLRALERLAARHASCCSTLVSAANVGVINLYARLGFHYDSTQFGYRKFL